MGLGLLIFLLFCLFALGAWGIAAVSQAKARHRQEMMDLIRGRKPDQNTNKTVVANTTEPLCSPSAPPQIAGGDAVLRRAQRIYEKTIAEVERDNRRGQGSGSRQPGPCTLNISYVDAGGAWSHRNVAPYKSGATNIRFDAWCDTRKGRRTFYFERIQCGTDLRTGCQLSQAGVFQIIHPGRSVPPGLE